jgi:hypothetical protein
MKYQKGDLFAVPQMTNSKYKEVYVVITDIIPDDEAPELWCYDVFNLTENREGAYSSDFFHEQATKVG